MFCIGDAQIIDVRSKETFNSGEHNGKGHIPSAINVPYLDFLDSYGNTKSHDELRNILSEKNIDPKKETIFYCGGGVTAAIGVAAAREIGFENVKLYDGSWAEWSKSQKTKDIK